MTSEFKKILDKIESQERQEMSMPKNLVEGIILRVNKKAQEKAKVKTLGLSFVSLLSLIASFPIISQVTNSFTQSGAYNYLSLVFSDSDLMIIYWKEILLTLAESIPAISIISLLAVVAVFVWSTLNAMSEVKKVLVTA